MRLAYQIESNIEFQQRFQFDLWTSGWLISLVITRISTAYTQIAWFQLHRLVAIAWIIVGLAHVVQVLVLPRIWFHFARWSRWSRVGVTRHSISAEGLHSYVASFPPTVFEKLWRKKGRKSIFWRTQSSSNNNTELLKGKCAMVNYGQILRKNMVQGQRRSSEPSRTLGESGGGGSSNFHTI